MTELPRPLHVPEVTEDAVPRFGVLGPLEVRSGTGDLISVGGPRPRALLVMLLLEVVERPARYVPVEALIDGQYGENPPADAANAVQAQVSRCRRALPPGLIEFHAGGYRLAVDPGDVDAYRFTRLAAEGHDLLLAGNAADAAAALRAGLALWRGPALPDLSFADAAVARLNELRLTATEDLAEAQLALPGGPSVAELRQVVAAHPLRERLRGQLVRALHAAGRRAEALEEFDRARRLLDAELGVDPGPELAAAHQAVLRAERPAPAPRRAVPAPLTTFVGRWQELARLDEVSATRLVTVLGPGGTGKTRLATEWANAHTDRTGAAVCFVDLAPLTDPGQVPVTTLRALGLRESGFGQPGDPVEHLLTALAAERLLLVVDNCEHVLGAVAALARTLLTGCRELRILATSREPLRLTGEALVPLGPLPLPPPETAAVDMTGYPAVSLFEQRAGAVRPGFTVGAGNAASVVGICAALDGLPLAIELAAARLRQFSVDTIAARLAGSDRFRLLSRGDPTAAARHRTLQAVVEWSWDLLGPEEQRLARRFTVFTGDAPLDAVDAVCGPGSEEVLAELVDRSFVETDGQRYRMLETIRLFCAQLLTDSGEEHDLRRAHALVYLALAREADPHLRRAEQLDWLARLDAEHANLIAALEWSGEHDRETAFELVAALTAYWWLSGRSTAGADVAAALLDGEIPAGLDEEYLACVMHAVPRADPRHWARGAEIVRTLDRGLTYPFGAAMWGMTAGLPEEPAGNQGLLTDDPWNRALTHLSRVLLGTTGGDAAGDEAEMSRALTGFRRLGDRWGCAQALDWLARLASWRGQWTSAYTQWAEALRLQHELGALDECAYILFHRAECLIRDGDLPAAEADFRAGEKLSIEAGQPAMPAEVSLGLAEIAMRRDDPDTATELLERALVTARSADGHNEWHTTRILVGLGRLAEARGAVDDAWSRHRDAVTTAAESPLRSDLADAIEGMAGVAAPGRAAELLGAAVAVRGLAVVGDRYVDHATAAATAVIGAVAFTAAYERGLARTNEEVTELLAELSARP
ncbi:ATP-binding protein [Amycolatopsis sp. NPDC088138]|uniref:ATP-binding protein n=1 Tax=Amycolatopsis sp. NPDC088138 TaxID=3363938 RepID=UPI0038045C01